MAIKTLYLGSEGPFKYDDTELVNDPDGLFSGVLQQTIVTDGNLFGTVVGEYLAPFTTKTANYTITTADHTILIDASISVVTLLMPTAIGVAGREYDIKKIDSSRNVVSIVAYGDEEIDGDGSINLTNQYEAITLKSDGANWWIF